MKTVKKKKTRVFQFLILSTLVFSCDVQKSAKLVGNWTAHKVIQDERILEVDLNKISFNFDKKGTYKFTSTLNYKEAGTYEVDGEKLITADTLNNRLSKTVLIEQLDSDTLKLKMKNEEGWLFLTMLKE